MDPSSRPNQRALFKKKKKHGPARCRWMLRCEKCGGGGFIRRGVESTCSGVAASIVEGVARQQGGRWPGVMGKWAMWG